MGLPKEFRQAALEELEKFQYTIRQLADTWKVPINSAFDYVGIAASKRARPRTNTWTEFQRKNFAAASKESMHKLGFPISSGLSIDENASSSSTPVQKSTYSDTVKILSEWYKKRTPEDEAELLKDVMTARMGTKRKRSVSNLPANLTAVRSEAYKSAVGHTQEIVAHLNILHTSLGLQSLVVIVGREFHTMVAGTLTDASLPYAKLFSQSIMAPDIFRRKLEGIVKAAEGLQASALMGRVRLIQDRPTKPKSKPFQKDRIKKLGERLRELYGKYIKIFF